MSGCGKVAYIDKTKNILASLPFLNDHGGKNSHFLKGTDGFFSSIKGWSLPKVRDSYVLSRFQIFLSSGIFGYWSSWYDLTRPKKIFQHYANWTHSNKSLESRLEFSSQISSGFYIYGIFMSVAFFLFVLEICKCKCSFLMKKITFKIRQVTVYFNFV